MYLGPDRTVKTDIKRTNQTALRSQHVGPTWKMQQIAGDMIRIQEQRQQKLGLDCS